MKDLRSLTDSVANLKGVGPKRVADLATLGIDTIEDLLTYYPTRYNDFTPTDIESAKDKQKITLQGVVVSERSWSAMVIGATGLPFECR